MRGDEGAADHPPLKRVFPPTQEAPRPPRDWKRVARSVLALALVIYLSHFLWFTIRNHIAYGTNGFDVGIFDQGVWLLSRFHNPFVTIRGLNLFGDHTSFILLGAVPLYWIFDSLVVLLVLQTVALATGAIPVFLLARDKLESEPLATACALAYLLLPGIQWVNWENFHPDSFEVPLILFAILFMQRKRWRAFLVCIVLVLLVKEDVALLTLPLGVYVAFVHDRRIGILTSLISLLWFVVVIGLILPGLNGTGTLYSGRLPYGGVGGTLKMMFTKPWDVAGLVLSEERPWYLVQLFVPVALFSLLAPRLLVVALPALGINLLSNFPYQHQIEYHYSTLIIPVIVAAAVYGIARLPRARARPIAVGCLLVAAFVTSYLWGPAQYARLPGGVLPIDRPEAVAAREAISRVPEDASVSGFYTLVTHMSHRKNVYEFPNPWRAMNWGNGDHEGERLDFADTVEYIVVPVLLSPADQDAYDEISPEFEIIFENDHYRVLARPSG
jgi:uncharacterized membrane protein